MYIQYYEIFLSENCKQMFVTMSGHRQNSNYVTVFGTKKHCTVVYGCSIVFIIL